uniref:hypothetical protein n=1 Tax=Polynucleobacter sp. TaxID=2029855 RepID=UPI0040478252
RGVATALPTRWGKPHMPRRGMVHRRCTHPLDNGILWIVGWPLVLPGHPSIQSNEIGCCAAGAMRV